MRCGPCGVLLALVLVREGGAQVMGPEVRANTYTAGEQGQPAVASDADGDFVIVWTGGSPAEGSFFGTLARGFNRLGEPTTPEFVVNTFTAEYQGDPAVAMWPAGGFVVTWMSGAHQDGDGYGVFGRRFTVDGSGAMVGGAEFQVSVHTANFQLDPDVAALDDGGFVVVWTSYQQDGYGAGVFGHAFNADGTPRGDEFRVNDYTTGEQKRPKVAGLPGGAFVVSWTSFGQDGDDTGVVARRFAADLTPGPEFLVPGTTMLRQDDSDVVASADGDFVVVWNSDSIGSDQYDIYFRRYNETGQPVGPELRVHEHTTGAQSRPSIDMDEGGDFVIGWTSNESPVSAEDVFAVLGNPADEIQPPQRVNSFTTGTQRKAAVAMQGPERYVVAWRSVGQDGSLGGIYFQRYGDLVMQDGFNDGNTAAWSFVADGGGDLAVTPGAALKGSAFGLELTVDDTTSLYVEDGTPSDEDVYRARFYLDPATFDPGEAQLHRRTRVFLAFEEAPNRRVAAIVLRRVNGQYALMGRTRLDGNEQVDTPFVPITPAPHFVEFHWKSATAPGANDGLFEMWIDDAPVTPLTGLDNDAADVDFVRMGGLSLKGGASGTLRFDEFRSQRETRVGP